MDDATTLAPRHARSLRSALAVGLAVIATLGVAACSGGDSEPTSAKPTTTLSHATNVDIPLGEVSADSAGPPAAVSPEQAQQVLDLLTAYVQDATVQPLRSGAPATADFATVFDPATLVPATTTDRSVVFDEGLPEVTGDLDVVSSPVALLGLGDQGGQLTLVSAAMVLDVKAQTTVEDDPLHVVRLADFVVQPDGFGGWRITSYSMIVTRDGAGLSPTTTTTTTGTGAVK
jgi:hypothetical protein